MDDLCEEAHLPSPSIDDELEPGRVIERYEVERLLGEGAMAAVYLVRHTTLETRCALKILTYSRSKLVKERMIQEGRTQARLQHENILQVFDVFDVDGMPALLLEYVDGPALDQHIRTELLPFEEAEQIFRGIVAGVKAAHDAGLVHRDLKPANILLQSGPNGPVPKVADFGLAKAWADEDAPSHTRAGTAMGTPQYMAPEQATNAKDVDHRADIFALGCIFYELVCGRRAFDGENLPTIFNQVLTADFPPPAEVCPELPARYVQLIEGCLEVQLDRRLPDCDAILAVLDGTALSEVIVPGNPSRLTWSPDKLDPDDSWDEPPVPQDEQPGDPATAEEDLGSLPPLGAPTPVAPPADDVLPPASEPPSATPSPPPQVPEAPPARDPAPSIVPSSVPPAARPALVLAALGVPAIAGLGLVLVGLVAAGFFFASSQATAPEAAPLPGAPVEGPCGGPRGQVVGYAWAGSKLDVEPGGVWTLERDRNVRRVFPSEANGHDARSEVVCVLRAGTRVRLDAPLEHPAGSVWVPIVAGSVDPD